MQKKKKINFKTVFDYKYFCWIFNSEEFNISYI